MNILLNKKINNKNDLNLITYEIIELHKISMIKIIWILKNYLISFRRFQSNKKLLISS